MSTIAHTDPATVTAVKITEVPRHGQTVTGYGPALPTQYMLRIDNRWHRVKMAQYGNAGSAYVTVAGQDHYLDTDTEYRLTAARDAVSA